MSWKATERELGLTNKKLNARVSKMGEWLDDQSCMVLPIFLLGKTIIIVLLVIIELVVVAVAIPTHLRG